MPSYPNPLAGQRLTAGMLRAMTHEYLIKGAGTARTNTTQTADPDLQGIALVVGVYEVKVRYIATGVGSASAGGLATSWGFTGTASAVRSPVGPGLTSTNSGAAENMRMNGASMGLGSQTYYVATTSTTITEDATVTVTVAGNMSINWAQAVTNATATTLLSGSFVRYRRIA